MIAKTIAFCAIDAACCLRRSLSRTCFFAWRSAFLLSVLDTSAISLPTDLERGRDGAIEPAEKPREFVEGELIALAADAEGNERDVGKGIGTVEIFVAIELALDDCQMLLEALFGFFRFRAVHHVARRRVKARIAVVHPDAHARACL